MGGGAIACVVELADWATVTMHLLAHPSSNSPGIGVMAGGTTTGAAGIG